MHKEDLCSNFVSLHLSLDCKDLDARLYIEVVGGISGKQIDLLSENLVVQKLLEKLWDEEATLKSLGFFFSRNSLSATLFLLSVFSTEGRYSAVIAIL